QLDQSEIDGAPAAPFFVEREIPLVEVHRRKLVHESNLDSANVLPVFANYVAIFLDIPRIPNSQAGKAFPNIRRQIGRLDLLKHFEPVQAMKDLADARRGVPKLVL